MTVVAMAAALAAPGWAPAYAQAPPAEPPAADNWPSPPAQAADGSASRCLVAGTLVMASAWTFRDSLLVAAGTASPVVLAPILATAFAAGCALGTYLGITPAFFRIPMSSP